MFLVSVALLIVGFIFWDRRKYVIGYRDPETGAADWIKSRPKPEGLEFKVKGYPKLMIRPRAADVGTWEGSVWPWSYPYLEIDPRTGRQLTTRYPAPNEDVVPDELKDVDPERLAIPWAHVYWTWLDADVVTQAIEAQKSPWAKLQSIMILGMAVMAVAFLAVAYIMRGGG